MKQVLRNGVFETNSSSVHTLTFRNELDPPNLPVENGCTVAHYGTFGKRRREYFSQEDKLSYLISYLYYLCGWGDRIQDSYEFENLERVVCEYCGTERLVIADDPSEPAIDHQSQPDGFGDGTIFSGNQFYDKDFLRNFIFNPVVGIKTDCD